MYLSVWQSCLYVLQDELPSQQFSMWVRPLQAESTEDTLTIYAPNRFVLDWVREKYLNRINELYTNREKSASSAILSFTPRVNTNLCCPAFNVLVITHPLYSFSHF